MARLYLPLDVMFFDDEKIARVGERPAWLYLAMCCKAKQLGTGGYLTEQQVAKLAVPGWKARVRPLLAERLVTHADGRYFIPAWANWNDTAEQVADRRRKDRERKMSARNPNGVRADTVSDSLLSSSEVKNYPPDPPAPQGGNRCAVHKRPRRGCADCAAPPLAAVPDWCGDCESDAYRWLGDGPDLRKCPRCHPSVVRSA